jgi:hypothetical protein
MLKRSCSCILAGVLAATCLTSTSAVLGAADKPALVLLLEWTALLTLPLTDAEEVNSTIAKMGVRDPLPFFSSRVGQHVVLSGGEPGNDSWFALKSVPDAWSSASGANDGLENYLLAGPGLGSPDSAGSRGALLTKVPNVYPLRREGLDLLAGSRVCAVVYQKDLDLLDKEAPYTADLRGPNRGVIAFLVEGTDVSPESGELLVKVEILPKKACQGDLAPFANAPAIAQ